jgi:nucleotide-binding universal stress UspA family protein
MAKYSAIRYSQMDLRGDVMMKTILVPTDGSAHARKAVDLAGDLAAKYNAKIVLLHVLLRGHMPEGLMQAAQVEQIGESADRPDNLVIMPQEIMARVRGEKGTQLPLEVLDFIGKRVLAGAEQTCREKGVKTVELKVEEGYPTEIILDYAKRLNADMIVMGSRGLSKLEGILMGSTSSQVSHLANCTCITVK